MLNELCINNFTIIEQLQLEIPSGMTVLTGETGAGKSIVIDALSLLLGGRAETDLIRPGSERCELSASFSIAHIPAAQHWLKSHDLYQGEEYILRRVIAKDGRSRSYINGQLSPLQLMRQLGELLVNIHGQHEHQNLLKREAQRLRLDIYAGHWDLSSQVARLYHQWLEANTEFAKLTQTLNEKAARKDLLSYQVQELLDLGVTEAELTELEQEHKQLANIEQLLQQLRYAEALTEEDDNRNVLKLLRNAAHALTTVKTLAPEANSALELIENAMIQISEAASELRYALNHYENNPTRLQEIEQRLAQIHHLARKHKVTPDQLPRLQISLTEELNLFESGDARLEQLQQLIAKLAVDYHSKATELSHSRKAAALRLAEQVSAWMQQLGMTGGQFAVQITPNPAEQLTVTGTDRVEFVVRTNPGQPLQPLTKVVSGGELSRISLALQVITAQQEATSTLIFDEVDVGIGGSIAAVVGQLLRTLGNTTQVLCVTHLPQVAAQGHHHLQVEKIKMEQATYTQIHVLDDRQRVAEIARMLGGLTITPQTLAHAQELLDSTAI